ncbi:MAG: hemerythrin domain-containing protein [bacterium]|nr:hemerythrin domain-containing protein [bacterium]
MYGIEVLVNEHENIKRMAEVMRAASLQVMNGAELVVADFDAMVDFIRNYADKHHHKKEEDVLFMYMKEDLGQVAQTLITNGMLVEHDLGRLHMKELDEALRSYELDQNDQAKLDVIVNTTGYTYLIKRHIDKENAAVFTFGERGLKEESRNQVDQKTKELEEAAQKDGLQEKYLNILATLEKKYL